MTAEKDPMGSAVADFFVTGNAQRLEVHSPMFDDDEIPVPYLFRDYSGMSKLEQRAIELSRGKILDVGAGAGCHSLVLQERNMDVTAIDISPLCAETMAKRGVRKVRQTDFLSLSGTVYDTILMLMNGIGIVGRIDNLSLFFNKLNEILAPGGQVLFDSSDICYVYEDDDGVIDLTGIEGYYGEIVYKMKYGSVEGDYFPWLYIDFPTFKDYACANGFEAELVVNGEHYDYLARLIRI